jgi:dihydrofolate reductase
MWNLVTLDGFFEGAKKWDIDWHNDVWGDELERLSTEQLRGADALLFGRVTYEGMAGYWPKATGEVADLMNNIEKVVFSRRLSSPSWKSTRLVHGDAAQEIARLKGQSGQDLLVFGSAELSASLIERDLFDEIRLCIVPRLLGSGTPLFKPSAGGKRMKLKESRQLKTGGVIVHYEPLHG